MIHRSFASRHFALGGLTFGLAALAMATTAIASTRRPVVVELFTSQGCSSCPPANANLVTLSKRPDVLALSFGVTYWDRLGWKDIFARPDYTDRQVTYEPRLGQSGPFTPQVVVDGRADAVGNDLAALDTLIAKAKAAPPIGPALSLEPRAVKIGAGPVSSTFDVWLVRYEPDVIEVPVKRGENTGRTLPHARVVRDLVRLGGWSGTSASFPIAPAAGGLRTAVLVQGPKGGPIVSAITD